MPDTLETGKIKIGIVEDDLIIARAVSEMLTHCGYAVTGAAMNYSEALAMAETEKPDLLLVDVKIAGTRDGVEVAKAVKDRFGIPFIFLTGNSDAATINRIKPLGPAAYLVKPVLQDQLFAAVEIAFSSFIKAAPAALVRGHIYVKDATSYRRIITADIIAIESEENYIRLYFANDEKMLVRYTLTDFMEQLNPAKFVRVHRSYIVAIDKIKEVQADQVVMEKNITVPVSRSYREPLLRLLMP